MAADKVELTWLGHATWLVQSAGHTILVDPSFAPDNPAACMAPEDVTPQTILVSHGHGDHISHAHTIARRSGAEVVANYEIAQWLSQVHKVPKTVGMNIGGRYRTGFGAVKMTHAIHSSQLPDGSYGGNPGGFLVEVAGRKIWFACDTALFSDMKLIGEAGIDLAIVPIGDLFTMGIDDSITATRLVNPRKVAPTHYNTWPPIEQDAQAWAQRIRSETNAEPLVPERGVAFAL